MKLTSLTWVGVWLWPLLHGHTRLFKVMCFRWRFILFRRENALQGHPMYIIRTKYIVCI